MQGTTTFESVREFSRRGIIPEATTRRLIKNNMVPGFFSGRKFLINTNAFIQILENAGNTNNTEGREIHA